MLLDFDWLRYSAIASVALYALFEVRDSRRTQDEREELIRLKTYELTNKVTLAALALLSIGYALRPGMNAVIPLLTLVLASLYSEILGKIFYRSRM